MKIRFPLVCFAVALLLATPMATVLAQEKGDAAEKVSFNFVDADITLVAQAVAKATGRTILVDPRVKGTMDVISPEPLPADMATDILATALRLRGYALVDSGQVIRIVPEGEAKFQSPQMRDSNVGRSSGRSGGEQVVTQVFRLYNESAVQLLPVLRPLITPNNTISAYAGANMLVITDYASNIERLRRVIRAVDVRQNSELTVIPVRYQSAHELAAMIDTLIDENAGAAKRSNSSNNVLEPTVVVEPRSNSLVVRSFAPGQLSRLRAIVAQLDIPSAAQSNIHVVPLLNAEASKMLPTLRAILSGEASVVNSSGKGSASTTNTKANKTPLPVGGGMVQADEDSNSLIITAAEPMYRKVLKVIRELDKRRAQVLVEALIVELTDQRAAEFGIQWQRLSGRTGNGFQGGTSFGAGASNIFDLTRGAIVARNGGVSNVTLAPGLNFGFLAGGDIFGLVRALESDARANILSTPNILTLDNEEAKIVIGQNVPFVTGSYTQANNAVSNPFQTYERKDVGLSLTVKPKITAGDVVRVQVVQEISSLVPGSVSNATGPITKKRSLETIVLVDDGEMIVLGGLLDDQLNDSEDKVPFLGDAPLLGGLFRYQNSSRIKTNLMVFLRPTVIRERSAYQAPSAARYRDMREAQRQFGLEQRPWAQAEPPPILLPLDAPSGMSSATLSETSSSEAPVGTSSATLSETSPEASSGTPPAPLTNPPAAPEIAPAADDAS